MPAITQLNSEPVMPWAKRGRRFLDGRPEISKIFRMNIAEQPIRVLENFEWLVEQCDGALAHIGNLAGTVGVPDELINSPRDIGCQLSQTAFTLLQGLFSLFAVGDIMNDRKQELFTPC